MSPAPPGPGPSEGKQTKQPATRASSCGCQSSGHSYESSLWTAISASGVSGQSGTEQRRRQARGPTVALEAQIAAVVDVHLDALVLERLADLRRAVDHHHDTRSHRQDVAAHRVVALLVDR